MKSRFLLTLLVGFFLTTSGCILAPFMDSASRSGLTAGSREKILFERVDVFHHLLERSRYDDALAFVSTDEARGKINKFLRGHFEGIQVVEVLTTKRTFLNDSFEVDLACTMRTYKPGVNTIKDVTLLEKWIYGMSSGWKLSELETPHP